MRKHIKLTRVLSFLVCFTLFFNISVYAAEPQPQASEQINTYSAILSRNNGNISISLTLTATDIMDTLGVTKLVVQRLDSYRWVDEKTFTSQEFSSFLGSRSAIHSLGLTYVPFYPELSYRVEATFYAKDSYGSTTRTVTSNVV